jgi:hypothetical protein
MNCHGHFLRPIIIFNIATSGRAIVVGVPIVTQFGLEHSFYPVAQPLATILVVLALILPVASGILFSGEVQKCQFSSSI